MKKILLLFISSLLSATVVSYAQKKLLTEINSINTKEVIGFKYNSNNQLIYFDEKGVVTYTEYRLKYDKTNQLVECVMNQDKGELILSSKYSYSSEGSIEEEIKSSGKKVHTKSIDVNAIHVDDKGRLTKTTFDDGNLWEEFEYDNNNNLVKYKVHSAFGNDDKVSEYKFDTNKSPFANITDFPIWFWTLHMNKVRWCGDFIGQNNAIENATDDSKYGLDTVEITYVYDEDGYPVKQYYDGELVKEFKYKTIQ
ncbi:MAG: hypothetical protein ACK5M3_11920 [Dysgonomonas sp.]